jgi:DNA-binding FadR family transcriptional regulator
LINQIIEETAIQESKMANDQSLSPFLHYLAQIAPFNEAKQLPSLKELSDELGLSISVLREQLEVAKALKLVEVKPRTGIRRLPYSFFPAVLQSLSYSLELSPDYFRAFADLRNRLEASYWEEAVCLLTPEDQRELYRYVDRAWEKLRGTPVQIPHEEHRQFHLGIYRRLDNPYVLGILDAYWMAYEAVGLSLYADINYLRQVWDYHHQMVEAISAGDIQAGLQALIAHRDMLFHRPDGLPADSSNVDKNYLPKNQALKYQG